MGQMDMSKVLVIAGACGLTALFIWSSMAKDFSRLEWRLYGGVTGLIIIGAAWYVRQDWDDELD